MRRCFTLSPFFIIALAVFGNCTEPPRCNAAAAVRVSETTLFGDMQCWKIETPSATYLFGKRGAGFASILDPAGHDWISYRHGGKALGEYRGLPKCGQPVKFFHCGYGFGQYTNDNWFTSTVTLQKRDHVRIHSETRQLDAACDWDFYPTDATLTLQRCGTNGFWFLYEGTPGGALDVTNDYTIRPAGDQIKRVALTEPWTDVVRWVAFGGRKSPYALVCVNHQSGSAMDSYVSWPYKPEADGGLNQMTVFGFGRPGWTDPKQHQPQLHGLPAHFSIALCPAATAAATARNLLQAQGH